MLTIMIYFVFGTFDVSAPQELLDFIVHIRQECPCHAFFPFSFT